MLVSLTAHHRTTPFTQLEALSQAALDLEPAFAELHSVRGVALVNTCNRFEAYFDIDDETDSAEATLLGALDLMAEHTGIPYAALRDDVEFAHGNQVARHLFAVSSGLESVVVGEDEIAGQVARALESARAAGHASTAIEALFQRANETSKNIKNSTAVSAAGRSVVHAALELAEPIDWPQSRVLLIGTGRFAAASLAALRSRGVSEVSVHSVSGRGERFATSHDLEHALDLNSALERSDVVVACTVVSGFAVTELPPGPHTLIDLGMPRNIAPALGTCARLIDLESVRAAAVIDDLATLDHARALVSEASHRFAIDQRAVELGPGIARLRDWMHELRDAELMRATSPEAEAAVRHFSSVLIHALVRRGREFTTDSASWLASVDRVLPKPDHD